MELRHLRYFVGVARELNFTRAAEKLRVAQPALSRQIRQLEDELGVALLERGHRRVELTEAGRSFLGEAEALLSQSEQAVRRAQMSGRRQQGQINVGYVWGMFHTRVPRWVTRFRHDHPDVAVNLLDLTSTQQAEALARGRLDLGFIGFAHEADAAGLARRKVGSCAWMAVLPANHPAARGKKVALGDLAQEFFIVISDQNYPGAALLVKECCEQAGFRPKILQSVERAFTIPGLVAGHCGITLLPESLQVLPHPGVVFRPLARPFRCDLFVAWNPSMDAPLARAFLGLFDSDGEVGG